MQLTNAERKVLRILGAELGRFFDDESKLKDAFVHRSIIDDALGSEAAETVLRSLHKKELIVSTRDIKPSRLGIETIKERMLE